MGSWPIATAAECGWTPGRRGAKLQRLPLGRGAGGKRKWMPAQWLKGGLVWGQRTLDRLEQNQPAPGQEVSY